MEPSADSARISPHRRVIATILCLVLVLAAVFLVVRFMTGPLDPDARPRPKQEPEAITAERLDQMLESETVALRTVRAFRAHYPNEYWAILRRYTERGAPDDATLYFETRAFIGSKAEAIASAPGADLVALAAANADAFETAQRIDVAVCAQMFVEGLPRDQEPPHAISLKLDRSSELQILAARRGEDGGAPARPPLSEADRQAWRARMRAIDAEAAALVMSGLETAADEAQCRAAVTFYRAAADLPADLSGRVTANIVRESLTRK